VSRIKETIMWRTTVATAVAVVWLIGLAGGNAKAQTNSISFSTSFPTYPTTQGGFSESKGPYTLDGNSVATEVDNYLYRVTIVGGQRVETLIGGFAQTAGFNGQFDNSVQINTAGTYFWKATLKSSNMLTQQQNPAVSVQSPDTVVSFP
jgi:hypothetical protein